MGRELLNTKTSKPKFSQARPSPVSTKNGTSPRLIGLISRYNGRLSDLEARLTKSEAVIQYVGASQEIREYANSILPIRIVAQVVAFALVPVLLSTYRFAELSELQWFNWVELVIDILCFIGVLYLLHVAYRERKRSGRARANQIRQVDQSP